MAEFCQPKRALKMPQPPPPLISGLQHWVGSASWGSGRMEGLTLTCQTLWRMSYEPAPEPTSEASPPTIWFHWVGLAGAGGGGWAAYGVVLEGPDALGH